MQEMAFFYGLLIIQIVGESFPVSSSGHCLLWQRIWTYWLHTACNAENILPVANSQYALPDEVMHLLHIPTFIIVLIFFLWWLFISRSYKHLNIDAMVWYGPMLLMADGITLFLYALKTCIAPFWWPLSVGFALTGLALFSLRFVRHTLRYPQVSVLVVGAVLGMVQSIALLPGISRFASTFVASRWLGFDRTRSFMVSWALQLPLLAGACSKALVRWYLCVGGDVVCTRYVLLYVGMATGAAALGFWLMYRLLTSKYDWVCSFYLIIPVLISCMLSWVL